MGEANQPETHQFTGKERDYESGLQLDYFGARYFSTAQGKFTTTDPSMLSAVKANPQSWNRYPYALNNPLRYVDPNGELWVSSGNANDPDSWVDECEKGKTCYESVAAALKIGVRVYGSRNATDITNYTANPSGMVDVAAMSGHANAEFESVQTPGREENYLAPAQGAALFNVAAAYSGLYPNDSKLVFTGGSTGSGGSALDASGRSIHAQSHRGGTNIDLRYMGATGLSLTGGNAAALGDVGRNTAIIQLLGVQTAGLGAAVTGDPARCGLGPIDAGLQRMHSNHMHFQSTYPPPPRREEVRAGPGAR